MKVTHRFPPDPASVPAVRRFVMSELDHLPEETLETVRLMVSELATNAVVYGGTEFTVEVDRALSRLIVSVMDSGGGTPEVQIRTGPSDLHGRGLFIVRELADDWGVTPAGGHTGKVVWFRVDLSERQKSSA